SSGVRRGSGVGGGGLADALHMSEGERAAGRTKGARRSVVGAARSSRRRCAVRTDDGRIDARAIGAGPIAWHTGADEVATRESADIGDGPVIDAGKVAGGRDVAARRL